MCNCDNTISQDDYTNEIELFTRAVLQELKDEDTEEDLDDCDLFYDRVCERLRGHEWINWYKFHAEVLQCSSNPNAYALHGSGEVIQDWQAMIQEMAFCAMLEDVTEEYHRIQSTR